MLSLNSLVDMFPHTDRTAGVLSVYSFHVECVTLLSKFDVERR